MKIREEKLARIGAVIRGAVAAKRTRGEGASKQLQRDDEMQKLKAIRADLQRAAAAVTAEVGALGLRVTLLRPVPATPRLADAEQEPIGTVVVPPCVPESVNKKTAVVDAQPDARGAALRTTIEYGAFKVKWADDAGTYGDDAYHPGIAVTRRTYFGEGVEVPLERSGAHVAADLELVITACFLTDGTPRPGP